MFNDKKNISIFILTIIIIFIVSTLPYINIFIPSSIVALSLYLSCLYFFRLTYKTTLIVALVVMVLSIPWILIGSRIKVEWVGEVSFYLLVVAVLQEAWKLYREK